MRISSLHRPHFSLTAGLIAASMTMCSIATSAFAAKMPSARELHVVANLLDGLDSNSIPYDRPSESSNGLWRTADDAIWRATGNPSFWRLSEPANDPDRRTFFADEPLAIAVPEFDYGRAHEFAIDVERSGNRFELTASRIAPSATTFDFRFPEDASKDYVRPVGYLPVGNYEATARFYGLSVDWPEMSIGIHSELKLPTPLFIPNPTAVDFEAFRKDPIGYELPQGWKLNVVEHSFSFRVVPEPTSAVQVAGLALTGLIVLPRWRQSKEFSRVRYTRP